MLKVKPEKKFEYEIAYKILNYDLEIINKELDQVNNCIANNTMLSYANNRLKDLYNLKNKKEEQINDLNKKYQNYI